MSAFTNRETAAILTGLRLLQAGIEGRDGLAIPRSLWLDLYYGPFTDMDTLEPLSVEEIGDKQHPGALCEQLNLKSNDGKDETIWRVDGEHAWALVICPGRECVERTLEQNDIPASDFPTVRPSYFAELKGFCERGYRPFVYQASYEASGDTYAVYYATDELEGRYRDPECRFVPGETHIFVRTVNAGGLEEVFGKMQSFVWSPNGEAALYIEALEEIHHTSMSVGDVVVDPSGDAWLCVSLGWEVVGKILPPPTRYTSVPKAD